MRPLIGIPCQADYREGSGRPIYCNNRSYVQAIEHAGGVPILIQMVNDVGTLHPLLGRLVGMLFSGGADIHPVHYSEDPHPFLCKIDQKLDAIALTNECWQVQEYVRAIGVDRGAKHTW